ncbi:FAD-dependent oxidoreductase [Nocardia asteroides]|uniref:FAD-dependent oxidoreductase n=1 Tax=Nocardia asteroides TaxID=1824 RepID=UPI001E2F6143|nr:FAD-dependent oxidoreductase [Nocardia asteroides]UGT62749.1 FAD-dependent oxidoreductase [Nocardia asteroides]
MNTRSAQPDKRFAVVGAGISGIAAAWELHKAGYQVDLLEQDDVAGGRFGVARLGDRPVMMGGKNLGKKYSALRGFLAQMGDPKLEPFGINTSRVVDGELLTIDSKQGPLQRLAGLRRMAPLTDLAKLFNLARQVRSKEENRFLGSQAFTRIAAAADHKPLSEHFGSRIVHNMFRAMTVRMNGAEPDEVYLGTFGTNLTMIMDTYDQLTESIDPVIAALSKQITIKTGTRVQRLVVHDGSVTGLEISERGGPVTAHPYDGVVIAAPAYAAAEIVKADLPALAGLLLDVRYFPAAVVLVEYDRPVFGMDVRAVVMDDGPCSNAGVYGIHDLHIVRYTFSGRHARPTPSPEQLEEWIDQAEEQLLALLPARGVRRVRSVGKVWEAAYCAYVPFHGSFLDDVRARVGTVGGLALAGDYLRGAPIESCFRSGTEAAAALLR